VKERDLEGESRSSDPFAEKEQGQRGGETFTFLVTRKKKAQSEGKGRGDHFNGKSARRGEKEFVQPVSFGKGGGRGGGRSCVAFSDRRKEGILFWGREKQLEKEKSAFAI